MSYRTLEQWQIAACKLPAGLTISEASKKLGVSYGYSRLKLRELYQFRRQPRTTDHSKDKLKLNKVDWSMPNSVIARKFNVSREHVRQAREKAGKPKVNGRKP